MATTKKVSRALTKPEPLTPAERKTLARILKKARAFKAYYKRKGGEK